MMNGRAEIVSCFDDYQRIMEKQTGRSIRHVHSDNGPELTHSLRRHCESQGIKYTTSVAYSPAQNGKAERAIRTLTTIARCLLLQAGLSRDFWAFAVVHAAHLHNRWLTAGLNRKRTPFEVMWGTRPSYSELAVFGCDAYGWLPPQHRRDKFAARTRPGKYIGRSPIQSAHRLWDPIKREVFTCAHASTRGTTVAAARVFPARTRVAARRGGAKRAFGRVG
jgi:hypothetical protein